MVEICIYRDENGSICKYIVSGHANYVRMPGPAMAVLKLFSGKDKNAGFDTVCASVSSITQNAIVGLKGVLGLNPGLEVEDGYLECIIPGGLDSNPVSDISCLKSSTVSPSQASVLFAAIIWGFSESLGL